MNTLFFLLFYMLPKNMLSRATGWVVSQPLPEPLRTWSVQWFQQRYQINMDEAEKPLSAYVSIGDLFTRQLKPGLRPIGEAPVHPADSRLTVAQQVTGGQLYQVKDLPYTFADLAHRSAAEYEGASVLTYYLCPTDYHRVHSPVSGKITRVTGVPGQLWPVNERSVQSVPRLFARNERVIVEVQTERGPVLVILVGATNVGQMSLSFEPSFRSNMAGASADVELNYGPGKAIQAGDELGIFHMGSTVIVVYPKTFGANANLENCEGVVKMGQSIRRCFQ